MLITQPYQAPLSKIIQKTYNDLATIIATINYNDRTLKTLDGINEKVSVSDIVAYQIGWGTLLITWYEAGLHNKAPEMPGEGFSTWDYNGLTEHFYKKYQYDSHNQQDQIFYTTVCKILTIVEHEYQTNNLDMPGVWAWCTLKSGKQWTLSKWITVNTTAPYKRAALLIRKYSTSLKLREPKEL